MKSRAGSQQAFTIVEIMVVVCIIGLLAALAIPQFMRSRARAQTNTCIDNLRQLDGAKQQWAPEHKAGTAAIPDATDVQPYLGRNAGGSLPLCPADSSLSFSTS